MQARVKNLFKIILFTSLAFALLIVPAYQGSKININTTSDTQSKNNFVQKLHPLVLEAMLRNPSKNIQVIVANKNDAKATDTIESYARILGEWDFINAVVVEVNTSNLHKLAKLDQVNFVVLNQKTNTSAKNDKEDKSTNAVNQENLVNSYPYSMKVDKVWEKGYDGSGVTVAVVDSGVKSDDDLGKRVIKSTKFNSSTNNASDSFGHGTHVSGIIAGDGEASDGKYIGVAPGVNLINVKFSGDDGSASEADLVNALQWVYENKDQYNIRVVNISSNVGTKQSYMQSAVAAAVEQLWFNGIVVVVSAGNRGGEICSTCYAPANDPYVITVGAVDDNGTKSLDDDVFKSWSSSGNTLDGHQKPDIMAPGVNIISYMPNGILKETAPERAVDGKYFKMSGTSMSAPMVTGVVALMLQANPELSPDQVKWILMNTSRKYNNQPSNSPGMVAADYAVFYDELSEIPSANQGLIPSPFINSSTLTIIYGNMSWSNMSWSNMSWSNSYRD